MPHSKIKRKVPEDTIRSLGDFVNRIEQIAGNWREVAQKRLQEQHPEGERFPGEIVPWFRGITNSAYHLEPSLLREDKILSIYNNDRDQIKQVEKYLLSRFRAVGRQFVKIPNNSTDWIYLMQHHGLPTRLLDWSKNALTALYFAIRKRKPKTDAAVWILDPRRLSEACGLGRSIIDPVRERNTQVREYFLLTEEVKDTAYPIPLIPPNISERLVAQHSRFTFHTDKRGGLERFAAETHHKDDCWYLRKLIIPSSVHPEILRALRLVGITQPGITPDLDSLAIDILQRIALGIDDLKLQKIQSALNCDLKRM
jgi:hypothetical protein